MKTEPRQSPNHLLEELLSSRCSSQQSSDCKGDQAIYTGKAPGLRYPVTVNLCEGHFELATADGWKLDPQ